MAVGRLLTATVLAVVLAVLSAGCTGAGGGSGGRPTTTEPVVAADDRYLQAVNEAARLGLIVWLESDLLGRWQDGRDQFEKAAERLRILGSRPGVAGIKVADELGTDDGLEPAEVERFLSEVRAELTGLRLLVDMEVPELGCAPGVPQVAAQSAECAAEARDRHPGATLQVVDRLVERRLVDALNISTSLKSEDDYRAWGIDRFAAQRAAWLEIGRRGWKRAVEVNGRKAMAVPRPYATAAEAAADLPVFIDVAHRYGANGVDVWTWRQRYQGTVVGISPGSGPLWSGLQSRRAAGVRLYTHFTPSQVYESVPADLARLATVFRGVFVAAGTG